MALDGNISKRNFGLNTLSGLASKLADLLASPSLVLPWIMGALGVPTIYVSFLVPIRRTVALFPQLLIARRVQSYSFRKWFWVAGAFIQAAAVGLMTFTVASYTGHVAGILILVALVVFSLARSLNSLVFKDVVALSIQKNYRGRLLASRSTLGGIAGLVTSIVLRNRLADMQDEHPYVILLAIATGLWVISGILFAFIHEEDAGEGTKYSHREYFSKGLKELKENHNFRYYVAARTTLEFIALSIPFYTLFNRDILEGAFTGLAVLLILKGLAEIIFSSVWGYLSDKYVKKSFVALGILSFINAVFIVMIAEFVSQGLTKEILAMASLFSISAIFSGGKIVRDTYLINATKSDKRPLFTSISNTISGLVALAGGLLGGLTDIITLPYFILLLSIIALVGSYFATKLPEDPDFHT